MSELTRHYFSKKISWQDRQDEFDEFLKHLVAIYSPDCVYVFGSFLEEKFDECSDFDVLVIFGDSHAAKNAWRKRTQLRSRVTRSFDLVAIDKEAFDRKSAIGGVAYLAKTEGKLVFKAL